MSEYLAIECATEVSSVALSLSKAPRILQKSHSEQRSNAQTLLPMVDALLSEADRELQNLSGICATSGPGSFTGIRIGMAVVQGLAMGSGLPVYLWSSLEVLAGAWLLLHHEPGNAAEKTVIAALDARMNEVYWAAYRWQGESLAELTEVVPPSLSSESDFKLEFCQLKPQAGLGSAFNLPALQGLAERYALFPDAKPKAENLIQLQLQFPTAKAAITDPALLQPLYLRNEITWKKRERIRNNAS